MARIVLTCMAGIVLTDRDVLMPRTQDAEERPNNPSAFPPFLEVRCTNAAGAGCGGAAQQSCCTSSIAPGRAGAAKHRTCESGRPWWSDVGRYDSRARIVLTDRDVLMPRTQDAEERPYNPIAFPPSLVVRRRTTAGQGLFPTIPLHFHRPWWSDAGRYDSREGGGRVAPGAATESNARLHGWRR